ncbi:MAG: adenylate/guanylate cyclase domain-containing protein [Chitinophagales bacterium]
MKENRMRQLAAVMFTDIVGYTALMQDDEELAMGARTRHREVFQQQHELHHGEIIQYYGDGTLSVFKSALEAAQCAIEIQTLLKEGVAVPIRIGLHMGDIVFNKAEVYGDGVNYASRIQSLGVAGAILLSGKLNDELKNHTAISTASLGLFKLKNIDGAVEIFAITNKGITIPRAADLKGRKKNTDKTIAVLPFVNRSSSEENEYFSDGITEEIINALSKIKNLKVTSRTSSFFFKNKNVPIRQIANDLHVAAILEGSIRLAGDKIRITAQLVDAEEDFHFWSESWDRKLENIFEIQDEISLAIAHKLRDHFGHFEIQEHLVGKQTNSIEAYEYFLKAKFHFNKWNPEDARKAISLFEKAIESDPNHTESYLGLAECYGFMATTGFMPYEVAWTKSAQLTYKANELNDQLPGVQYQLANLSFFASANYTESFKQATAAIALKPNYVEAHQFMSFLQIVANEKERAFHHLEIALSLDPLSKETLFYNAYFDYMLEDFEKALEKLNTCLVHNPSNLAVHIVKCHCLLKLNRCDEVINYFDTMPYGTVGAGEKLGLTGLAYALKNDTVNTEESITQLAENAKGMDSLNANSYLFLMYVVTGENDKAFEWIGQAIEKRYSLLLLRFGDPLVNPIKGDKRYSEFQKIIYAKE